MGKNTLIRRDHCEFLMNKFNKSYWVQFKQLLRTELAQKIAETRYQEICLLPEALRTYKANRDSFCIWFTFSMQILIFMVLYKWS